MNSDKTILVVSNTVPYPSFFGGAFDILERIKGLKKLGFTIHLICTYKEYPKLDTIKYLDTIVDELMLVKRKNNIKDLLSLIPLQVISRNKLIDIELKNNYRFTILESEYVGSILKNKTFKSEKIFLRIHNNEYLYFKELAKSTKNIFNKIYYYSDALKFKLYSKSIFTEADRLWYISNKEIKTNHNINKSIHLPAAINDPFVTQELSNKTVLFVGSMFMKNNTEALDWYLKNVHTKLLHIKEYKLIIVGGTGDIKEAVFLKKYNNYSNTECFFNVKNIKKHYQEGTIFINPMLHGAGVKLKTINSIVNGLLLVSTSIGSEGIGLVPDDMYLLANNPESFCNAILSIFEMTQDQKQKIVLNAQNCLKKLNYLEILNQELNYEN